MSFPFLFGRQQVIRLALALALMLCVVRTGLKSFFPVHSLTQQEFTENIPCAGPPTGAGGVAVSKCSHPLCMWGEGRRRQEIQKQVDH